MHTLQELLEVENDSFFANYVCPSTGILVWPVVRNTFVRLIISDMFYASEPYVDISQTFARPRVGKVALRAALHNMSQRPRPSSVLMYASGGGLYEEQGLSRNRFTHGFSETLAFDCWSLEGLANFEWPLPRDGGRVSFSLPALARIEMAARLRLTRPIRRMAEELVGRAAERAKRLLGWELGGARREWLSSYCARKLASYPLKERWFRRWLERVEPRLVLVEEGCYEQMAVLNATARRCGVLTAEFQHGIVTAGHYAYNVAPALESSEEFRRTLPDYFLGYGAWWNRQFNAPTERVIIGNPHRQATLERLAGASREEGRILVLGGGRRRGRTSRLAES